MASPIGFEPTACRLGGDRSILLSYGDIRFDVSLTKKEKDDILKKSERKGGVLIV